MADQSRIQSQPWPDDRAVLFIHGVGAAKPGDYSDLVAQFEKQMGDDSKKIATYFLYYDEINEWFSTKFQASALFSKLTGCIRSLISADASPPSANLGNVIAGFGGDVLWPVLLADARLAVRSKLLAQLQQIARDGRDAKVQLRDQRVSIIAHSMGCYHAYEAMTHLSRTPGEGLGPASTRFVLDNLIFMASPVQLISTVGKKLGNAVEQKESIYSVSQSALEIPFELDDTNKPRLCAKRTVSITGNLDPVGGHIIRKQLPWAYMKLPGQQTFIDQQQVASVNGSDDLTLTNIFNEALKDNGQLDVKPTNPHSWGTYVAKHADDLKAWLA